MRGLHSTSLCQGLRLHVLGMLPFSEAVKGLLGKVRVGCGVVLVLCGFFFFLRAVWDCSRGMESNPMKLIVSDALPMRFVLTHCYI